MLSAIDQARQYILFEMYLMESSKITTRYIDALLQAADRGVTVYMLLDDFGSRGLKQKDRNRLAHDNIKLANYNPLRWTNLKHYFFRDHRKLLLVDGEVAFTGSAGITIENDPNHSPQKNWRDTMIEIRGPVLSDWKTLFEGLWNRTAASHLRIQTECPSHAQSAMHGRVTYARPMKTGTINRSVLRHGLLAKNTIWLATAYFNPPRKIRRMLCKKARQNVDVRLLLPGKISDHPSVWYFGHRHYEALLRAGVRIFEFQPQFMHTKAIVCDDWCSIGSSNFDRWELPRNLEANQEIASPDFADQLRAMLENDFNVSQEILFTHWAKRSWHRRIREWFWSQVGRFFDTKKRDY